MWQAAEGDELVPASKDIVLSEDDVQALREKYRIEREKRLSRAPKAKPSSKYHRHATFSALH